MRCVNISVLITFMAASVAAWAGPQEDYEEGEKAFERGDMVSAMATLRKAADQGHAKAQARLGYILDKSELDDEALSYYRKSADQGEAAGEYGLGTMYAAGEGVKKDMAEARKWYVRSAEKNYFPAVQSLAGAYIKGDYKVEDGNREQVLRWLESAAEGGYMPAAEALVKAYKDGDFGVTPDPKRSAEYQAKLVKLRSTPVQQQRSAIKK